MNSYCCSITIPPSDKIGPVNVRHIPRKISKSVYFFLHEGGAVSGTAVDTKSRISCTPEWGLEIKLLQFTYPVELILKKMKEFSEKQLFRLEDTFKPCSGKNRTWKVRKKAVLSWSQLKMKKKKMNSQLWNFENDPTSDNVATKNVRK